jgi:hypothetical protein
MALFAPYIERMLNVKTRLFFSVVEERRLNTLGLLRQARPH